MSGIAHGSYAGYQKCRRTRWGACPQCKAANAEYKRGYRAVRPEFRRAEQVANNARTRALWKLAGMFPDEFRTLLDVEMAKSEQRQEESAA